MPCVLAWQEHWPQCICNSHLHRIKQIKVLKQQAGDRESKYWDFVLQLHDFCIQISYCKKCVSKDTKYISRLILTPCMVTGRSSASSLCGSLFARPIKIISGALSPATESSGELTVKRSIVWSHSGCHWGGAGYFRW